MFKNDLKCSLCSNLKRKKNVCGLYLWKNTSSRGKLGDLFFKVKINCVGVCLENATSLHQGLNNVISLEVVIIS